MTKFEIIGVKRQLESDTKKEAKANFRHSCKVCCYKGMKIDCKQCSIAYTHKEVMAIFDDIKRFSQQSETARRNDDDCVRRNTPVSEGVGV